MIFVVHRDHDDYTDVQVSEFVTDIEAEEFITKVRGMSDDDRYILAVIEGKKIGWEAVEVVSKARLKRY